MDIPGKQYTIYLAGGLRSGWQEVLKQGFPFFRFIDPRDCTSEDPAVFTAWDLDGIRQSDMVFAYLEPDNPTGYALALEIGFAKALSKEVVFVDERSARDTAFGKGIAMVRHSASEYFQSFEEGLDYLRSAFAHAEVQHLLQTRE